VLDFLLSRKGRLEGVVVTGGEPTVQTDLAPFLRRVRALGFSIKVDTNGSRPSVLKTLLLEALVDYIAMDVKAPLESYQKLAGVPVDTDKITKSMEIVAGSGVRHEFRTTWVKPLLSDNDMNKVKALVPPGSPLRIQEHRPTEQGERSHGDSP
jgi:pyruvate formate lyase activating enzyme